ncbi:hypothetical protein [Pantoea piersonii]|uniref:hypothetical protein n=1 Tax=Pantoea piersonii TaxID=2364647 RepID=UPI0022F19DEF|nr:hypothetical protein [Pantoea piersonii]WBV21142.1 hypothetical protein PG877_16330 [Pantoea piersonii]
MRLFFTQNRDLILSVAGIFIAVISLVFSIWQGHEQIRHNHISVEPRINSYFSNDGRTNKWGVYIVNNGMGTAFVKDIFVRVNGRSVDAIGGNIFLGAVQALGLNPECFVIGGPRPNDSFKVGEEIFLIEARGTSNQCAGDNLRLREASQTPHQLDFILDIESIYGDEFRYSYSKNKQEPQS